MMYKMICQGLKTISKITTFWLGSSSSSFHPVADTFVEEMASFWRNLMTKLWSPVCVSYFVGMEKWRNGDYGDIGGGCPFHIMNCLKIFKRTYGKSYFKLTQPERI
jgi:hypothetical protein